MDFIDLPNLLTDFSALSASSTIGFAVGNVVSSSEDGLTAGGPVPGL